MDMINKHCTNVWDFQRIKYIVKKYNDVKTTNEKLLILLLDLSPNNVFHIYENLGDFKK